MSQYGNCAKCGAENLMSQRGKAYCSKKCWLNESQGASYRVAQTGMAQQQTNAVDAKWQKIRDDKDERIGWYNALNNTCLLIAHGKVNLSDIQATANKIYEMEYTGKPTPAPAKRFDFNREELPVVDFGEEIPVDSIPF